MQYMYRVWKNRKRRRVKILKIKNKELKGSGGSDDDDGWMVLMVIVSMMMNDGGDDDNGCL